MKAHTKDTSHVETVAQETPPAAQAPAHVAPVTAHVEHITPAAPTHIHVEAPIAEATPATAPVTASETASETTAAAEAAALEVPKPEYLPAAKEGAKVMLTNGVARVDYIKKRYAEGATRSAITKEVNELRTPGSAPIPYQIIFGATKPKPKPAPAEDAAPAAAEVPPVALEAIAETA
jgi:hypothetical protein